MSDFGKAGKMTIRENDNAVMVNISKGEYLYYKLTVEGAIPIFTFACTDKPRFSADHNHPHKVYEWTWCKDSDDSDSPDDLYGVAMLFMTAIKYTLVVEHLDKSKNIINTLKDIDYESQEPSDNFTEVLRVFTA
jgi:hypothetical protein